MQGDSEKLRSMWARGVEFLGTKYAIMGGAMSWVSDHNLVSAISNSGGFGILACGSMTGELLVGEIRKTKSMTDKPFGVNLLAMVPTIDDNIKTCIAEKVSHVVLAGGIPKAAHIKLLKDANIKVIAFAPSLMVAKRMIKSGVDALVIEGMEAGGHIGAVATSVLVQEILPHITEVPVFVAGGIGRGDMIHNYLSMGASGCQLGTLFVCATESIAHEKFKQAFIGANSRDAVPSFQVSPDFPIIPVRAIKNKAYNDFIEFQYAVVSEYDSGKIDKETAKIEIEKYWAGALRRAVIEGDVETGSVMAGQCVGMVDKIQPTADIINTLIEQLMEAANKCENK